MGPDRSRQLRSRKLRGEWLDGPRFQQIVASLEDDNSRVSREFDRAHDRHVVQTVLDRMRGSFAPATMQAFEATVIHEHPVKDVANELEMTEAAVYIARSRVLRKLRQRLGEMVEIDEMTR